MLFNAARHGKSLGAKATFNKTEANEIRRAFIEEDITATQLAKEYEVSVPTMLCVLHGKGAYRYAEDVRFIA